MGIKLQLYHLLVNRDPEIKLRYEQYVNDRRDAHTSNKLSSWLYLARLNAASLFHLKMPCALKSTPVFRESVSDFGLSAEETADRLCTCDIVSFDVFDTLIFRPFSSPADLFYLVGERLGIPDYRNLRRLAESTARMRKNGSSEVTADEIFACAEEIIGIPASECRSAELELEEELCYANSFMLDVWNIVRKRGKTIIITSDMYIPSEFLGRLLIKNGYSGFEKIFVSCEHGCGKYDGGLWDKVIEFAKGTKTAHIGDNPASDVIMAEKKGIKAIHYPNVNSAGNIHRCRDMSSIVGSAYSGIVNSRLYSGRQYPAAYEYGYKVGGIAVLGYCGFIHKTAMETNADKILFFSRDGYILKKVYDELYPDENTAYVYWSRAAAAKLGAYRFRNDFFRRFIFQKTDQGYTIEKIMDSMGLSDMKLSLAPSDILTPKNAGKLADELTRRYSEVTAHYDSMDRAAKRCFSQLLDGCRNALAADCGWAGSGAVILNDLVNRKWKLGCCITGTLAGTNTANQSDSDFTVPFLQSGMLRAYCFSPSLNRDIYIKHYPALDHNVYFEMLFGAPHPSFLQYEENDDGYGLIFDTETENEETVAHIHLGELDFVHDYLNHFGNIPYMLSISGRDAYAPFMFTVIGHEKEIKAAFPEFVFDRTAAGKKDSIMKK